MTSRISNARDANGNPVTIEMLLQGDYESLICAGCPAPVEFVKGFTRRFSGGGIGVVEPYIRLMKGCSHSTSCDFHITREIAGVVRNSNRGVVRELAKGSYEFDLLVVRDAVRSWQLPATPPNQRRSALSGDTPAHDSRQTHSITDREALRPYINDAMKVLRLRACCESNAEMQAAVVLLFGEHRITWSEFYYEHKNYFRCVDYVSRRAEQPPVAVRGWIQHIGPVRNGPDAGKAVLHLTGKYRPTDAADVQEVADFSIYARDPQAFKKYARKQEILILGLWDLCEVEDSPNHNAHHPVRTYRQHKLRMELVLSAQICAAAVGLGRRTRPRRKGGAARTQAVPETEPAPRDGERREMPAPWQAHRTRREAQGSRPLFEPPSQTAEPGLNGAVSSVAQEPPSAAMAPIANLSAHRPPFDLAQLLHNVRSFVSFVLGKKR